MAKDTVTDEAANEPADDEAQHPADPKVEVAQRAADTDAGKAESYRKEFVILASAWETDDRKALHERNLTATRQELTAHGLRATGAGKFASSKEHDDGRSVTLAYTVPAQPAAKVTAPAE